MEQGTPVTQKIRKSYPDRLDVAVKYYGVISLLNNIHLTKREVELVAFTAVKGSISAGGAREEFVRRFNSSKSTVNNMIADLQKDVEGERPALLVKNGSRITVIPRLQVDFQAPLHLNIHLSAHATD